MPEIILPKSLASGTERTFITLAPDSNDRELSATTVPAFQLNHLASTIAAKIANTDTSITVFFTAVPIETFV